MYNESMEFLLPSIRHDFTGFNALANLCQQTKHCSFEDIKIDLQSADWFDADMCAVLGAICHRLSEEVNNVSLLNLSPKISGVLSRNGFLRHFGKEKVADQFGTAIAYRRFQTADEGLFARYVEEELVDRDEIPQMSKKLAARFMQSIYEIFNNAVLHSRTEHGIFSCGQFYPTRKRISFLVADLGIGIHQCVRENTDLRLSPVEAIDWATKEHNTTKASTPGGLGLPLLTEFADLNGGKIRIVSDSGYWARVGKKTFARPLNAVFSGAVVYLEINTEDNSKYVLESEG